MADAFDLDRFIQAQNSVMDAVRQELAAGAKQTHWMWFVFPQLAGLGRSGMAQRYAIGSLAEAAAYLKHPVLGPRQIESTELVLGVDGRTAHDIFGAPDDMKFHSSLTLFAQVPGHPLCFDRALSKFFAGKPDQATLDLLAG